MAKEFIPMFEESEDTIKNRELSRISDEWRKEPGDFIYDAVAPVATEIQLLQMNQDTILQNAFPQYAEGEFLDDHLESVGLSRIPASQSKRRLIIKADAGVVIPAGYIVSSVVLDDGGNPLQFTVDETAAFDIAGQIEVDITSVDTGTLTNLSEGSEFILLPPIPGIQSIIDGGITVPARDPESDEDALERYLFKVSNEDTGGNKNDYVRWVTQRTDVGAAKCIPRWAGNNTVKVVIVGTDFKPATPAVVKAVQNFLDPGSTGLGEGRAPMGAAVTVEAAAAVIINISATIVLRNGYTISQVQAAFEASVTNYLKDLVFTTDPETGNNYPVAFNQIGALLITTAGVMNYSGLKLNNGTVDVPLSSTETPVLGTVSLT